MTKTKKQINVREYQLYLHFSIRQKGNSTNSTLLISIDALKNIIHLVGDLWAKFTKKELNKTGIFQFVKRHTVHYSIL